jgi:two-component system, chemotaxis family, chemotaxis protein CheY
MDKPLILIVEDDPDLREAVAAILIWEGYRVAVASNGQEALQALAATSATDAPSPGVVLLDMRMPILDGWGMARALQEQGLKIPIVVMTDARRAWSWAQEVGAVEYLPKPFGIDDLLATIAQLPRRLATASADTESSGRVEAD